MKIGFIGGGNMAEAMIKGMTSRGMKDILVSEPRQERRRYLEDTYRVGTDPSNVNICSAAHIIVLAVKPQNMENVLDEIRGSVTGDKIIVSIAAGVRIGYLSSKLGTSRIVRVMPNTPALIQKGMTVMSLCECFSESDISAVRDIFISIGEVITLPEKYMDTVTAISGSGPAFITLFIECMIEAGVKLGLEETNARILAVQTAVGTAGLLETGMPPSKLREMVTSPGGTTAAGLEEFDKKGLRDVVTEAVKAAARRAAELGKGGN